MYMSFYLNELINVALIFIITRKLKLHYSPGYISYRTLSKDSN